MKRPYAIASRLCDQAYNQLHRFAQVDTDEAQHAADEACTAAVFFEEACYFWLKCRDVRGEAPLFGRKG